VSYAVKEVFLTLQGEGMQAGRRAVFLRFSGCNLWTGREEDRAEALCSFCDTDFVGMDGENGGRYEAGALAAKAADLDEALIAALHARGFEIAVETNGTLPAPPGIDWICVSPKAGTEIVQRSGDELKLVWPQQGIDPDALTRWDFRHFLIQPMDCADAGAARDAAIDYVLKHPRWRLSLQTHKLLGLP